MRTCTLVFLISECCCRDNPWTGGARTCRTIESVFFKDAGEDEDQDDDNNDEEDDKEDEDDHRHDHKR